MKRTYLDEFVNAGLIDEEELIDGRKTKVWYPTVDLDVYDGKSEKSDAFKIPIGCELDESMGERLRNITQHHKLLNNGLTMELDEKWLEESILKALGAAGLPDIFEIWTKTMSGYASAGLERIMRITVMGTSRISLLPQNM